jgi:hypothetical protein
VPGVPGNQRMKDVAAPLERSLKILMEKAAGPTRAYCSRTKPFPFEIFGQT